MYSSVLEQNVLPYNVISFIPKWHFNSDLCDSPDSPDSHSDSLLGLSTALKIAWSAGDKLASDKVVYIGISNKNTVWCTSCQEAVPSSKLTIHDHASSLIHCEDCLTDHDSDLLNKFYSDLISLNTYSYTDSNTYTPEHAAIQRSKHGHMLKFYDNALDRLYDLLHAERSAGLSL